MATTEAQASLTPVPDPTSISGRLRALRDVHQAADHGDLELPGWGGLVGIRVQSIESDDWETLQSRLLTSVEAGGAGLVDVNRDLIIMATRCLLIRDSRADDWQEMTDDQGVPIRWDASLAEAMGYGTATARQLLGRFLAEKVPQVELVIPDLGSTVMAWLKGEEPTPEAMLGKS